jgi:hypothetical protein
MTLIFMISKIMKTNKLSKIILGIAIANIVAILIIWMSKILSNESSSLRVLFIFSDFIIVPILMGIICAYFWKDLNLQGRNYEGYSIINSIVTIALSYLFLSEGYICLIIVSPLLIGFNVVGVVVGKVMFKKNKRTLNVSIISLLFFVFVSDSLSQHDYENKVSDTIIVNAPPEKVWKYVVAYEPNKEKENYWLFKIGMPSPMESTVDKYCVGGNRKCIFSNGYVFDEKMTVFKPNVELVFDITHQPRDPEIMGHINILRGQFLLKDNGNGTTTLIGNSWYSLHVFPIWYYDIWASSITRNVHLRVMEHIKALSEKNV